MGTLALTKEVVGSFDQVIQRVTEALKAQGFGILTRIDFHEKMKEKLGKDLPPLAILGACNPQLAFEAYQRNTDVTGVMPCNAVVRQSAPGKFMVELAKPSELMKVVGDSALVDLAKAADQKLADALKAL